MADARESSADSLGFIQAVAHAFSFLESDYGFERKVESANLVRYEQGPFFVNVICEIGVNVLIGREFRLRDGARGAWRQLRHMWGVEFPIEYLAEAVGVDEELDARRGMVRSSSEVEDHVARLAEFVRNHGRGLLIGDEGAYETVAGIGRRRSHELTRWASGE